MSGNRGGRRAIASIAMAFALIAGVVVAAERVVAAPAGGDGTVGLLAVGPVDHSAEFGGFPIWYKDTNDLRLELCVDEADVHCIPGLRQDAGLPISFPTNFPDEAFWWAGVADMKTAAGGARLVMALEAAFGVGPPAIGDQIAFSRIRLRVDGLPVGDYTVTHPYGVDSFAVDAASANGRRSINITQDTGDFSGGGGFDVALSGRIGPFLTWDSDLTSLPTGYLADPLVSHTVTGSPFNTAENPGNIFRIVGPLGAFDGSLDACPGVSDGSCISTDLFSVQAKESFRAGVEATRVGYSIDTGTGYVDVFANSLPDQIIRVTDDAGGRILETQMIGDGSGRYFARIPHGSAAPSSLTLTNVSDSPPTVANVSTITDTVHVNGAVFDRDAGTLTVTAQSSDEAAELNLVWGGAVTTTGVPGAEYTFLAEGVLVPPAAISVVSTKGGADDDDVVITGSGVAPVPLVAVVAADPDRPLVPGELFSLDGSSSTGSIDSYTWTQPGGAKIAPFDSATSFSGKIVSGLVAPDLGEAGGQLIFNLTVAKGAESSSPSSVTVEVSGLTAAQQPWADAGTPQTMVVPGTIVTLDGSASQNVATYKWIQEGGATVTLSGADTSAPWFIAPPDGETLTFKLIASNAAGMSMAWVDVTVDVDDLTVVRAQFKGGGGKSEWRVTGTSQYCAGSNTVTVELMRAGDSVGVIGTATPAPAAPGCDWSVRTKSAPSSVDGQAGDWIRVTSSFGGLRDNQTFRRG